MTFQGAKFKQHGLRCTLAIVPSDAVKDDAEGDRLITLLQEEVFERSSPVVLMTHDPGLGPAYYGRADLVRYLERVDVSQIAWVEYTVASSAFLKQRAAFPGLQPAKKAKTITLR